MRVSVDPDPSKHVIAHVFKVAIDPFVGKLGIFRVHQGTVKAGAQCSSATQEAHQDRAPVPAAGQGARRGGEVCPATSAPCPRWTSCTSTPCCTTRTTRISPPQVRELPAADVRGRDRAEKRGEEQKLSESLHHMVAEDPCVRVEHHTTQNETVIYGLGELHLRVMLQRMTKRFGMEVKTSPPSVPYNETITRPAEGHHRHKKQTGGAGQFGEVYLRVEPLPRGSGFEFVDDMFGGAIPGQFMPAVEKGVRQVLGDGAIAGFPLQDVRVGVYDGKYHAVDSKEIAFVTAGKKAFVTQSRKRARSSSSRSCGLRSARLRPRSAT